MKAYDFCADREERLLLQAALCPIRSAIPSWEEWRKHFDYEHVGRHLAILPFVYTNLEKQVKDPILEKLKGVARYVWVQNHRLLNQVKPLLRTLAERGIPLTPIKGLAMMISRYSDSNPRYIRDADILVPASYATAADLVIREAGWVPRRRSIVSAMRVRHSTNYLNSEKGDIDLHWECLWCSSRSGVDESFAASAREGSWDGIPIKMLRPEDHFVVSCIHGGLRGKTTPYAHCDGILPTWILDAVTLIQSSPMDWERVLHANHRMCSTMQMRDVLLFLQRTFEVSIPEEVVSKFSAAPYSKMERLHYYFTQDASGRASIRNARWARPPIKLWAAYMHSLRRTHGLLPVNQWSRGRIIKEFLAFLPGGLLKGWKKGWRQWMA
jgi:hypothetical protein